MSTTNGEPNEVALGLIAGLLQPGTAALAVGTGSTAWLAAVASRANGVSLVDGAQHSPMPRHLRLLRIGTGSLQRTLTDLAAPIGYARVDAILFDRLAADESSALSAFPEVRAGYRFFRIEGQGLSEVTPDTASGGGEILAIHQRLAALFLNLPKDMLNLAELCRAHGIVPRGVVHIGAHEGAEWATYAAMGITRAIFIEANPQVFARLSAKLGGIPGVVLLSCAILDRAGPITLRVASSDQSSSVLPMSRHRDYYPMITESETVEVPGKTLDGALAEHRIQPALFNLMNIDIQGAELMALHGATETLRQVEAVNVEVNFEELYEGCAQIEQLEDFLRAHGFRRVAITCPFHPSWGDAFYVRVKV